MEKTIVIALHGFLGLPADWKAWWQKHAPPHAEFLPINLWTHPTLNSSLSFIHWTEAFIEEAQSIIRNENSSRIEVWGYSMGGRLALSAITQAPHLFQRAVILSANPGIENDSERDERLKNDLVWSNKFLTTDWDLLMQEWNGQPIFQIKNEEGEVFAATIRSEASFDRTRLSQALDHWSLARQPNFWPLIQHLNVPLAWHVGALDTKYVSIARKVKQLNPQLNLHTHSNYGHRLLDII